MPRQLRSSHKSRATLLKAILIGATAAALLDLLDPLLFYGLRGVRLIRIPQSIAAGLLGHSAYTGGVPTAILGIALHVLIALFWATLFVLAARVLPVLSRSPMLCGLLYGSFIYAVMNDIVLPRSHAYVSPHPSAAVLINGIAAIVILVGPAISLANRRFAPPPRLSS